MRLEGVPRHQLLQCDVTAAAASEAASRFAGDQPHNKVRLAARLPLQARAHHRRVRQNLRPFKSSSGFFIM